MRALLAEGKGTKEIARLLGISPGTVCYHKRRLAYPLDERFTRRYDWDAIQAYYDSGHTMRQCQKQFGFSAWAWAYAVRRGAIESRPKAMPLKELLIKGPRSRNNIKQRLIAAGLKEDRCEMCGLSEWRDEPLSMQLHHRNGNTHDNRLKNLALLCANCHSQTDTYGAKKRPVSTSPDWEAPAEDAA